MLAAGEILFGEQGFNAFLLTPHEGRYVNSPKNFLGAKIPKRLLDNFETLVVRFLSYLKQCAEKQLSTSINKVVIARPVNYHSTMGELGNKQAEALMLRAAHKVGFSGVVSSTLVLAHPATAKATTMSVNDCFIFSSFLIKFVRIVNQLIYL